SLLRPRGRPAPPAPRTSRTPAGTARASRRRFDAEVDRCGRLHGADVDQEIDQTLDQGQAVEVVQVPPPGFASVVPSDWDVSRVERDAREVEDHEVVGLRVAADPLHPAEESLDDDVDAGLLACFAHGRRVQPLAEADAAAGQRPLAGGGAVPASHEEKLAVA